MWWKHTGAGGGITGTMRSTGPQEEGDEEVMRLGSDAEWEIAGDEERD